MGMNNQISHVPTSVFPFPQSPTYIHSPSPTHCPWLEAVKQHLAEILAGDAEVTATRPDGGGADRRINRCRGGGSCPPVPILLPS